MSGFRHNLVRSFLPVAKSRHRWEFGKHPELPSEKNVRRSPMGSPRILTRAPPACLMNPTVAMLAEKVIAVVRTYILPLGATRSGSRQPNEAIFVRSPPTL